MRRAILASCLTLAAFGAAIAQTPPPAGAPPANRPPPLMLSSTAITDGGVIPNKYTVSSPSPVTVPLSWTNTPAGTQSFALIIHDVDVVMQKGLGDNPHWIVFNIPGTATSLTESPAATPALPEGSIQMSRPGRGGAPATTGFSPPGPPPGFVHHYNFDLYALDIKLPLATTATRPEIQAAMEGHVLGKAVLQTSFKR